MKLFFMLEETFYYILTFLKCMPMAKLFKKSLVEELYRALLKAL